MENSKFRPILFSTPMVQAILENRKTMTRRTKGLEEVNKAPNDFKPYHVTPDKNYQCFEHFNSANLETKEGYKIAEFNTKVGDVLWVRETFELVPVETSSVYNSNSVVENKFQYKADGVQSFNKWKPSIFMPKEACRIFLKIKAIRVERLQDISEDDCKQEGVFFDAQFEKYNCYLCQTKGHSGVVAMCNDGFFSTAKESFISLWESINGKQSFEYNPFVFVYEFEQIEKPLDFIP